LKTWGLLIDHLLPWHDGITSCWTTLHRAKTVSSFPFSLNFLIQ